jgi:hypothetical protein
MLDIFAVFVFVSWGFRVITSIEVLTRNEEKIKDRKYLQVVNTTNKTELEIFFIFS